MAERVPDPRVLPPSIGDERGRALLSLMTRISGTFDWRRDLAVTWRDVPSAMLPYAVRSLALQELMVPGLSETVVRRLVEHAVELKALQGKVSGIRFGLGLLGMKVVFEDWHRQTPKGPPGTYKATVFATEYILDNQGSLLDEAVQVAALAMIDHQKRWSQEGELAIGIAAERRLGVAAVATATVKRRAAMRAITRERRGLGLAGVAVGIVKVRVLMLLEAA